MARVGMSALAVLALLIGVVFALQGLRVLPSQVMYGDPKWVLIGAALILGSLVVLWRSWRKRS
jgi:hypothetical protein